MSTYNKHSTIQHHNSTRVLLSPLSFPFSIPTGSNAQSILIKLRKPKPPPALKLFSGHKNKPPNCPQSNPDAARHPDGDHLRATEEHLIHNTTHILLQHSIGANLANVWPRKVTHRREEQPYLGLHLHSVHSASPAE